MMRHASQFPTYFHLTHIESSMNYTTKILRSLCIFSCFAAALAMFHKDQSFNSYKRANSHVVNAIDKVDMYPHGTMES